ncbi:YoaK family protein [Nakamurella endophytica]|uniref:DUF1275 domain-containing protein n=1 Tax=Nakamurella endophytica TaxID=1748367 RepID=A0A917SPH8_9ACTN|nr:YoaK family protein [Nakamurella endophytica]GGL92468.1 hypothetical protein GCM10011594_10270 [Nakamurella endophytica]
MSGESSVAAPGPWLARLPLLLSIVAGLTDVTTFVLLGGVFSAHITGNLVVLAADLATGRPVGATTVLAVPFFVAIAAVVTALAARSARPPSWWVTPLLAAQCVFLAAAGTVSTVFDASASPHGAAAIVTGLLAVAAMAVQNALLHVAFTASPSTAVMTGNVVEATVSGIRVLVGRPGQASADRAAWRRTWPLIAGFLAGCLAGAAACWAMHDPGWVLPVAAALAVAVAFAVGSDRQRPAVGDRRAASSVG